MALKQQLLCFNVKKGLSLLTNIKPTDQVPSVAHEATKVASSHLLKLVHCQKITDILGSAVFFFLQCNVKDLYVTSHQKALTFSKKGSNIPNFPPIKPSFPLLSL